MLSFDLLLLVVFLLVVVMGVLAPMTLYSNLTQLFVPLDDLSFGEDFSQCMHIMKLAIRRCFQINPDGGDLLSLLTVCSFALFWVSVFFLGVRGAV